MSLDEILEIVSTLADRESGARIICECHGERVVLTGDAGRVLPLRLSAAEGAVLNHELNRWGSSPRRQLGFDTLFYPKSSATTSASLTPSTTGSTGSS